MSSNNKDLNLTHNERKILRSLQTFIGIDVPNMTVEAISVKTSISSSTVKYLVNNLESDKLIEWSDFRNAYELTPKGKEQISIIKFKYLDKLLWSIIVPVITTLITNYFLSK